MCAGTTHLSRCGWEVMILFGRGALASLGGAGLGCIQWGVTDSVYPPGTISASVETPGIIHHVQEPNPFFGARRDKNSYLCLTWWIDSMKPTMTFLPTLLLLGDWSGNSSVSYTGLNGRGPQQEPHMNPTLALTTVPTCASHPGRRCEEIPTVTQVWALPWIS